MSNEFDDKLAQMARLANGPLSADQKVFAGWQSWMMVRNSTVFVTETLDLCWIAARSVFQEKAAPEQAFAIYDRVCRRLNYLGEQPIEEEEEEA